MRTPLSTSRPSSYRSPLQWLRSQAALQPVFRLFGASVPSANEPAWRDTRPLNETRPDESWLGDIPTLADVPDVLVVSSELAEARENAFPGDVDKATFRLNAPTLFLDIDGVLHPLSVAGKVCTAAYEEKFAPGTLAKCTEAFQFAPVLEQVLGEFPQVQVVIHSTWRNNMPLEHLRTVLPPAIALRTVGMTETWLHRYRSIEDFVHSRWMPWSHCVVLDDDERAFPDEFEPLVATHSELGLGEEGAEGRLRAKVKRAVEAAR